MEEKITMFVESLNKFATINVADIEEYGIARCGDCNDFTNESQMSDAYNHANDEIRICRECADSSYHTCSRCDYMVHTSIASEVEGDVYCSNCLEHIDYNLCNSCYGRFYSDNLIYSSSHDAYYCDNCYQSVEDEEYSDLRIFESVIDYPEDASITKPYYGLEIECHSRQRYELSVHLYNHSDVLGVDSDGSLSDCEGIEIKTQPRTLEYFYTQRFKDLLNDIKSFDSYTTGTKAGLHIHIDRRCIGRLTAYKFAMFMYIHSDNFIKKLSMRDDYYYCSTDIQIINDYKRNKYNQVANHKYSALNNVHSNTYELRIFKGNLRYDRIMRAIEFFEASRVYFSNCSLNDISNLNKFLNYIEKHKKRYEYLYKFILEKFKETSIWNEYEEYKNQNKKEIQK